ncbi:MAG: bifunctional phosphoribosyl-AMP cyclohydrolase/phosphoribosyl-ATP diphosphatase HisIE [Limnochordales bacterium]|nr:bifunctional phosphoribosyl-AMP cyclohydrolase/phosphoribosyl-ATP diphosphatase HisIE [Limnochordales bacterium]
MQTADGKPLCFQNGLIPAIVQDARTGQVLMLAYMNEEALQRTLTDRRTWFWSRSRQELWPKGETSGNFQEVISVTADCDGDALLVRVNQHGTGACHEGDFSCFHHPLATFAEPPDAAETGGGDPWADFAVLQELWEVIRDRQRNPRPGSYTASLLQEGPARAAQKVGEEAVETVIEAVRQNREAFIYEAADLLYHLLVLLAATGVTPAELFAELRSRRHAG